MQQGNLPKDFLPVEEAIKLIQAGTRDEPTVDTDYLIAHTPWIERSHNFTIPLLQRGDDGRLHKAGYRYVFLETEYDAVSLDKCIHDQYKKLVGHEYDEERRIKRLTTTITDADNGGNSDGRLMQDKDVHTKVGDIMGS